MSLESKINYLSGVTGNSDPIFFILGPCVIESEEHSLKMAEQIKNISEKLKFNFIFKSSFDKANRSAISNYRGVGIDQGLRILEKVRTTFEIPVITDIHEPNQADLVADVVDVIQIPAFLCRQTDLLVAAGETNKIINLKKGQFIPVENMEHLVKKIESTGNNKIWVTERGYTFGYNNLIVDYRNFPVMKSFGKPVVFDATHSVQRPGGLGCSSGGDRSLAPTLSVAAVVQGVASVFMEVHDEPEKALCDGPNSVRLSQLEGFLKYLIDLDHFVKSKKMPELS